MLGKSTEELQSDSNFLPLSIIIIISLVGTFKVIKGRSLYNIFAKKLFGHIFKHKKIIA